MIYLIYAMMAAMAAAVTAKLAKPLGHGKSARILTIALPVLAIGIYLSSGKPEMPSVLAVTSTGVAERHAALLAQKPYDALKLDPQDIGALLALGDINANMGRKKDAAVFYHRASDIAKKRGDIRGGVIENKLNDLD